MSEQHVVVALACLEEQPAAQDVGVAAWRVRRRRQSELATELARSTISGWLGVPHHAVQLARQESGAPRVEVPAESNLSVSISHDDVLVGCAIGEGFAVGLDVAQLREFDEPDLLSARALSVRERRFVETSDSPHEALLRLLSRKEAVLKALGVGIVVPLAQVEVLDDGELSVLDNPDLPEAVEHMTVRTLEVAPAWLVSVAAAARQWAVTVRWRQEPCR